jgi:hypothetical protein
MLSTAPPIVCLLLRWRVEARAHHPPQMARNRQARDGRGLASCQFFACSGPGRCGAANPDDPSSPRNSSNSPTKGIPLLPQRTLGHNEYRLRFRRPNSRQKPLSAPAGGDGSARSGKLAPRLRSSIFTRETSRQQNDTGATGSED